MEPAEQPDADAESETISIAEAELDQLGFSHQPFEEAALDESQSTANGEPAELLRANHILRAVSLPAGDHVIELRYDDAEVAFTAYLAEFPESTNAPNAQYWLAESFYVRKQYGEALEHFQTVLETAIAATHHRASDRRVGCLHMPSRHP